MALLDTSLVWIYQHAPRILDLFDDVENFYITECNRAASIDRWKSELAVQELRRSMAQFLSNENTRGEIPHGCHKLIRRETGKGYIIAHAMLTGKFTKRSRSAALAWLSPHKPVDDTQLSIMLRNRLKTEPRWQRTWPYSTANLAKLIGVSPDSLIRFMDGRMVEARSLEQISTFLVEKGAIAPTEAPRNSKLTRKRMDRGIEANLANYVAQHPLNKKTEGDNLWPLRWNLTNSSRDNRVSLYEAIRYCIPSAARIVIGVFQARRESELSSLTTDCMSEKDDDLWFESYIAKSLRRDKKLPTVKTVADAIAVLERWSIRGRKVNGTNLLFSHWEPLGDAISIVKPNEDIKKFADFTLKKRLSSALQVRQFRRFFAVTFMWRYRLANLPALSDFLCHDYTGLSESLQDEIGRASCRERVSSPV